MTTNQQDDTLFLRRQAWLEDQGRTEGDVMEDDEGEYICVEDEPSFSKLHLPLELQAIRHTRGD